MEGSCMRADYGRVITIVDIVKAFDTNPHSALKQCLQSKDDSERIASHLGLMYNKDESERIASHLGLMYNDCWTTLRMGSSHSIKIQLKPSVNQGNPLSPLLLNVTLDPMIEAINSGTTGIDMARKNCRSGLSRTILCR